MERICKLRAHYWHKAMDAAHRCFYEYWPEDDARGSKHIALINTKTQLCWRFAIYTVTWRKQLFSVIQWKHDGYITEINSDLNFVTDCTNLSPLRSKCIRIHDILDFLSFINVNCVDWLILYFLASLCICIVWWISFSRKENYLRCPTHKTKNGNYNSNNER
jgi:hypothetical protein